MGKANRVLVAGIGNTSLGDHGFGSMVAQRLAGRTWPDGVRAVDFGIRGLDAAYALAGGFEFGILIDAMHCGQQPGTLYVVLPEMVDLDDFPHNDSGGIAPESILRFVRSLHGDLEQIIVVGCEPMPTEPGRIRHHLSAAVEEAADQAVALIESLVAKRLALSPAEGLHEMRAELTARPALSY